MSLKVRKRTGTYPCTICSKVFNRLDHLKRHAKNHNLSVRFTCKFCPKTFIRSDVRTVHEKIHGPDSVPTSPHTGTEVVPEGADEGQEYDYSDGDVPNPHYDIFFDVERIYLRQKSAYMPPNGAFAWTKEDFDFTSHTFSIQQGIDSTALVKMQQYIPSLQNDLFFKLNYIEYFLSNYWSIFHPQFPVLHKPSFSSGQAHPLLLLSMVLIGSALAKSAPPENLSLMGIYEFTEKIAIPLRWLLLSCPEATPPCKSWLIHSLIILEMYEMNFTARDLYERACVYGAVKVQLLRRSPFLGDALTKSPIESWVENESMKRVAWEAFYVDTLQAIVLNCPVNLYANNLKLPLPCPDEFWEAESLKEISPTMLQSPLISESLRRVLQKENVSTGHFGYKIILIGILNLILQMEQTQAQSSVLGLKSKDNVSWQDTVASALHYWKSAFSSKSYLGYDNLSQFHEFHAAHIYLRIRLFDYYVYAGSPHRVNVRVNLEDYAKVEQRMSKWAKTPNASLAAVQAFIFLCGMIIPEDKSHQVVVEYEPGKDPVLYRTWSLVTNAFPLWGYIYNRFGKESSFKQNSDDDIYPCLEDAGSYLRRIRDELGQRTGKLFCTLSSMDSESLELVTRQYAEILPQIPKLQNIAGLMTLLGRGFGTSNSEPYREYGILFNHCANRSMGCGEIFCDVLGNTEKH